ncbi:MAG: serine/threonine-protein kinase, partial [Nannocystaceae bacterium]
MSSISTSGEVDDLIARRVRSRLFPPKSTAERIGRFLVLEQIGRGGMGTVYAAYDERLDRKVAIKVLLGEQPNDDQTLRLEREAQALARLSHPNVVGVHEVAVAEGELYLAMEFVRGESLDVWLRTEPPWPVVLDAFIQAGRGLAAAHEAGLVHRDFKPANVMRGDDGVVKVLDFGLARASTDEPDEPSDKGEIHSSSSTLSSYLTQPGALMGTPAYMATEQLYGMAADARSDQFSFCVTMYEGLYGERPYEGSILPELIMSMDSREVRSTPKGSKVPAAIRKALLRGLDPKPSERWPSMEALLVALEGGRRRSRWPVGLGVLVAATAVVAVAVGWQQQREREGAELVAACEAEGAAIDKVWNDDQRERLRSGLLSTKARFAPRSVETLIPWLDEYRDEWSAGRTEACLHRSVQGDWDEQLLDRASWCFEDRRLQLEATVDQIIDSSPATARRAVRTASYLDPVSTCLDPDTLARLPIPPPQQRDDIRSIRSLLTQSDRLRHSGMYGEALEVSERAVVLAEALGWPPLTAQARLLVGRSLMVAGRYEPADAALTDAYFEALDAGSTEVAFRAARSLIRTRSRLQRHRDAETWSRHADALSSELADPSGLDEAERHYLLNMVYRGLGDYETAAREGEQAVAQRQAVLGPDHPITASATRNLGAVYLDQHRPREALERFEHADDVWSEVVGVEHPYVGQLAVFRGSALRQLGRLDEALELVQQGLAVDERVLRPGHPQTATALDELAQIQAALGRLDEAEHALRRSMAIRESLGPRDPDQGRGLLSMAVVDLGRGEHEVALERCDRAIELLEGTLDSAHPEIPAAMERRADVLLAMGRYDEAQQARRAALLRRELARGPDDRQLMVPLVELGELLRRALELEPARLAYERALSIGERAAGDDDYTLVPSLTGL